MNTLLTKYQKTGVPKDLWFDLIRIYIGLALMIRGVLYFSAAGQDTLHGFLDQMVGGGWGVTAMIAHYIIVAHLAGGLLLAVGLLTRIAAAVQIPILFGAVFLVHFQDGLFALGQSLELSGLVLFLLVMIAGHGPGRLSMDSYLATPPVTQKTPPPNEPVGAGNPIVSEKDIQNETSA